MQEGVEGSLVVLAVVTGDGPDDANAYLNRPFCLKELRWAFAAGKHLQPVVHLDDKKRIGDVFIPMVPDLDLRAWIGASDFVDVRSHSGPCPSRIHVLVLHFRCGVACTDEPERRGLLERRHEENSREGGCPALGE